ncbi:MAG: hypothetical protein MI974_30695 [Chitinophagales bacterium]|nr:hypothetical protein [Chitinophagales bacterium]
MIRSIFLHEFNYWLRQPAFYIYAVLTFAIPALAMWGTAVDATTYDGKLVNAPIRIFEMLLFFQKLLLLLIPLIMGTTLYRDFSSRMHTLLYSYPIAPTHYFTGKYLSAFFIMMIIGIMPVLGIMFGSLLPGISPHVLASFDWNVYFQAFLIMVLPTIFIFGSLSFSAVALSRNIYTAILIIIASILIQGIFNVILGSEHTLKAAALIDPLGENSLYYLTRFWSVQEQNERLPGFESIIFWNRFIWIIISIVALLFAHYYFRLAYSPPFAFVSSQKVAPISKQATKPSTSDIKVNIQPSLFRHLKLVWNLSNFELIHILRSKTFLGIVSLGLLFIVLQQLQANPPYGFRTLPATWLMLRVPTILFLMIIQLLTFLYAGNIIHRSRTVHFHEIEWATPTPPPVLLASKLLSLIKMQVLLLMLIMIGGISVQLYKQYFHIQAGLYLFELFGLRLGSLIIWAVAALLVNILIPNKYLAFFFLLLGAMGISGLPEMGITTYTLQFNNPPVFQYSEMDAYGSTLCPYSVFMLYWSFFTIALLVVSYALYQAQIVFSLRERMKLFWNRIYRPTSMSILSIALTAFIGMGYYLYNEEQQFLPSNHTINTWKSEREKLYGHFKTYPQPKITDVQLNIHLFPRDRSFEAQGRYLLINKTDVFIDTLLLNYSFKEITQFKLPENARCIFRDSIHQMDMYALSPALPPGDSILLEFEIKNRSNTLLSSNSKIKGNGTFFTDHIFPGIGYNPIEISSNAQREAFHLPLKPEHFEFPADSIALLKSYSSIDADLIALETIISTEKEQIALAPGYLQESWQEGERSFYHYKMDVPIKDFYGFNSGKFAVEKDKWKEVSLEIYHYPAHTHNLQSLMRGLKACLDYQSQYFSDYQHQQARIIEFPITAGEHATTFANSIPFSEARFISTVDKSDSSSIDLAFYVAAHEMAHQWWGNQLIPADLPGSRMLTESLAEYTALRALENEYGKAAVQKFLRLNLEQYLTARSNSSQKEQALMYAHPKQTYITYRKGGLAMYTLSEQIGEEQFNFAIQSLLHSYPPDQAPYPTSQDLIRHLRIVTPDSLQYLITDWLETITLCNYQIQHTAIQQEANQYLIAIDFTFRKYRCDGRGQIIKDSDAKNSVDKLPLGEYVEIGCYDNNGKLVHVEQVKITQAENQIRFLITQPVEKARLDPRNLLLLDFPPE